MIMLPFCDFQINISNDKYDNPIKRIFSNKRKKCNESEKILQSSSIKRCNSNRSQPEVYRLLYTAINEDINKIDRINIKNEYINDDNLSNITKPVNLNYSTYWTSKDKDILNYKLYCKYIFRKAYFENRILPESAKLCIDNALKHVSEEITNAFPPDPALNQYSIIDKVTKLIMNGKTGKLLREECSCEYPTSYDVYLNINVFYYYYVALFRPIPSITSRTNE